MNRIEILGYAATALVALSFLFTDAKWLRALNSVGAALFIIYGFLTASYPVCAVNGFILCVNLYHLAFKTKRGAPSA